LIDSFLPSKKQTNKQASIMAEEGKKKRKKGLFGKRIKKKKEKNVTTSTSEASSEGGSEASPTKKKKNFGARFIKGMVRGRTRRKKEDADGDNSLYAEDYDPHNPPKPAGGGAFNGRQTALDPEILAQVVEDESFHSDDDDHNGFSPRPPKRMPSKKRGMTTPMDDNNDGMDTDEEEDDLSYGEEMDLPEDSGGGGGKKKKSTEIRGPISLVVLLVDPDTLRFELLQLEFDTPNEVAVSHVMDQISTSVTEPAIRMLEFTALVDRQGKAHVSKSPLAKALTQRNGNKDILVGLSKGVTTEHCGRLARPILGDSKVIGMVR
jgi:hypothetical protein